MFVLVIIASASIGAFLLAFHLTGVVKVASRAIATSRQAIHAIQDPVISELERERTVQKAAITLVGASASLILRGAMALAAAFVPLFGADWAGISSTAKTLAFMERWDVILVASVLVTMAYMLYFRMRSL